MEQVVSLATDDGARQEHVARVLSDALAPLIERDPRAFRRRFRKMAADPFAFYRGSAHLFYADMERLEDRFAAGRTDRVWIQGDLHAENFGTYMSSDGVLVFDVNDFDEAYLGHYTWDLRRMAASLALIGFAKALSDQTIETMVQTYARSYVDQVRSFVERSDDDEFRLTLANTEGALHDVLRAARGETRIDLLAANTTVEDGERRFRDASGVRHVDADEQGKVYAAYQAYLDTIPADKRQESVSYRVKDLVGRSGFGIGSAGLPAYNLLIEGRTEALENDVILSMKEAAVPAAARVVTDEAISDYFSHQGHRTALSQRALQAHADPWLGWCEIDGTGYVVAELSPYEADLDWAGLAEPDEILPLLRSLGGATAKIHCVSDSGSDQGLVDFQTETEIAEAIGDADEAFADELADFGLAYGQLARDDHRRFVDAFRGGAIPGLPAD